MKSIQNIIDNQGVEAYRVERDRLKGALVELIAAYKASSSPTETLDCLSNIEMAAVVIASLVNCASQDGRISNVNKKWASTIGYNDTDAIRIGITGDEIHRAHLNQLASAIQLRIRTVDSCDQRINYTSSQTVPPELKRAVEIAHRIMMDRMDKESENDSSTSDAT